MHELWLQHHSCVCTEDDAIGLCCKMCYVCVICAHRCDHGAVEYECVIQIVPRS